LIALATVVGGCAEVDEPSASFAGDDPNMVSEQNVSDQPPNVVEWEAASQMLQEAADLTREVGWQQNATEEVEQVCVATAVERVFLRGDYSVVDFNYAREAISRHLGVPRDPAPEEGSPFPVPYWGRHLMERNDAPERTEEEVIAAFEAAAQMASDLRAEALEAGG
jgi:hypothetical protein